MENFNDSKALAIEIAKILDKKKAHDVRVLKVESLTVLTDYFVIASGTSTTQVASLADEVEYELSQKGLEPYSTEGGEVASRSDDGEGFAGSRPVCLIHSRVLSGVRYSEISMGSPSAHRCSRS